MKFKSLIAHESGNFLHHAYLIEGETEAILKELFTFFERSLHIATKGNPDFLHLAFDSFGIDEGRKIREIQTGKAFEGNRRLFVISATVFTHEAQNSLLKVFEDPSPNVHFFVIMPSADGILPTLRSRFFVIEHQSKYESEKRSVGRETLVKKFLSDSQAVRLLMIRDIIEDKDKARAFTFFDELEKELHIQLKNNITQSEARILKQTTESLKEVSLAREYLHDRSSSMKLILEHLALALPK